MYMELHDRLAWAPDITVPNRSTRRRRCVCLARVRRRARDSEGGITWEYLRDLSVIMTKLNTLVNSMMFANIAIVPIDALLLRSANAKMMSRDRPSGRRLGPTGRRGQQRPGRQDRSRAGHRRGVTGPRGNAEHLELPDPSSMRPTTNGSNVTASAHINPNAAETHSQKEVKLFANYVRIIHEHTLFS